MRRMYCTATVLALLCLISASCGEPGAGNAGNRPVNSANNAVNTGNSTSAPVNSAAVESDVRKLVTDTAAALAKNDVAALDKMYDDRYMLVNLDGSVQNKAERLGQFRSGETKFESFAYDDINIRVNPEGTGAVVIARATAKGTNKGKPVSDDPIRVTQVWSKTKDGWRQISGHAVAITAAEPAKPGAGGKTNEPKPPAANN